MRKIVCIILALLLTLNPVGVGIAWAQEVEVTPAPETVPSEPQEIVSVVENESKTEVSNEAVIDSSTGSNEISGGQAATVETGEAESLAGLENNVNLNVVEVGTGETVGQTAPEQPVVEGVLEEGTQVLVVENNNTAEVKQEATVGAVSGENEISKVEEKAEIETGNAVAVADVVNLVNTNVVGSNFDIKVIDIGGKEAVDINSLWNEVSAGKGEEILEWAKNSGMTDLVLIVENLNRAYLENNISVMAESGKNIIDASGSAEINTGDALALANVANIVNTNIVGSDFFFGIFNVWEGAEGDLILPRPEKFLYVPDGENYGGVYFINDSKVSLTDNVAVTADTGNNLISNGGGGVSSINTGSADAIANILSKTGTNIIDSGWYYLLINDIGSWQGEIINGDKFSEIQEENLVDQNFPAQEGIAEQGTEIDFDNQNQAEIINNVRVSASTGKNQISNIGGNALINTGSAKAIANIFNMVNTNILGSHFFAGIINILGGWSGNLIFAYPDVRVDLEKADSEVEIGGTTNFNVSYQNIGYDFAKDVKINIQLPAGFIYLSDSSGLSAEVSGQDISWSVGDLEVGEEGNISIAVKVDPNFNFEQSLGFWQKIIHPVIAAENLKEKEVQVTAQIRTSDPESNLNNNSSSTVTIVYQSAPVSSGDGNGEIDQRQPNLEITSWNNVNGFVYPGDTVTFEITIQNTSDVPAYETVIKQNLYNGMPESFGTFKFNIGTVEPGEKGTLSFGLKLPKEKTEAGPYRAVAQAFGKAANGNEIASNEAKTGFNVKFRFIAQVEAVMPEEQEGQTLGAATEFLGCENKNEKEILPYVLLFLLSSAWLIEKNRNLLKEKKIYAEK